MADKWKRPVRIANCSGAAGDPGVHMYNQAKYGPVDFITGDYLAEINLADHAEDMARSAHPGWAPTALDGLEKSLELLNEKRIKVVINGGALNSKGLAERVLKLIKEKSLDLRVAYVDGDNLTPRASELLTDIKNTKLPHLDSANSAVKYDKQLLSFLDHPGEMPIVCANAYLGYRAIQKGLDEGADIILCGRVADASPVIGAAAWWHGWKEDNLDALAGALVGGHLIECSTYVTGANFAGFFKYEIQELLNLGLPIVEIDSRGHSVVTKHDALNGIVTEDTVKCQLLYELQGTVYLNSDVKADLSGICITEQSKNRVHVSGIKGYPPPDTTKLAIFYRGGWQNELLFNASGYATEKKWDLQEAQLRAKLEEWGLTSQFDVLDFQRVGTPKENPDSQLSSTSYMRVFAQSKDPNILRQLLAAWLFNGMAHFAGFHCSMDFRTAEPKPFLGYYPAIIPQSSLDEGVHLLPSATELQGQNKRFAVGPPKKTDPVGKRDNYETNDPVPLGQFGPTQMRPLGDIALGRSGDKGANVNIGLYVHTPEQWDWLRSFLTRTKMKELMGKDWQDSFFIERVEMPKIYAVHFVIYGPLGRGVSSSRLLDSLGKGFAEYIRAVYVPIPSKFFE